jgi:NAD dependent epimerase/dehydratase family enzyme
VDAGVGGPLGSGDQYQPWISIEDEVAAISFLLESAVRGPVNLTGPDPVTQKHFIQTLARIRHRPALLRAPGFALRLALGQFADEGVLVGQRAVPAALTAAGYQFVHPTLEGALRAALA